MQTTAILLPMLALAGWTAIVLTSMPILRFRAVLQNQVTPDDFKYGESASVPASVSLVNRNYMNLLELPMLFYVVCLLLFALGGAAHGSVLLAWAYVALRIIHSAIHIAYNNVLHRLTAFALSTVVLLALWVQAGLQAAGGA